MPKNPSHERQVIVCQPKKRPYGTRARIHVQTSGTLGDAEEVCVPLSSGAFLTIEPTHKAPWEGGKKYVVTLEGFATAAAAEAAGRRLVQALLWMAVSTDAPLKLEYLTYEPASVFERRGHLAQRASPMARFRSRRQLYSLNCTMPMRFLRSLTRSSSSQWKSFAPRNSNRANGRPS